MRWTRAALLTRALACGRRSRVVLTPRRWRQVSREFPRGDGGKKARSPGRARNKPLKPLRRECRIASAEPVCSCAFVLCTFAHETAGAARTRCSLRPLFGGRGKFLANLGRIQPRTREAVSRKRDVDANTPSSCPGLPRASITLHKNLSKKMDCRVKPGNDELD